MRRWKPAIIRLGLIAFGVAAAYAAPQQPSVTVFQHATVIDPDATTPLHDAVIVVVNKRIAFIGKHHPAKMHDVRTVDLQGKYVIPGLWDMHTHWSDSARVFPLFIANGVLGTRNMAAPLEQIFQERADTASGAVLGPKIYACGPVLEGPDPFVGNTRIIHNTAEAKHVVDDLKAAGADFLKTYDGLPRDSYFAMAAEAKRVGIPFEGHLPLAVRAREAVAVGQKSFEHGAVLEGTSTNEDRASSSGAILSAIRSAEKTHDFPSIPATIAREGNLLLDGYDPQRAASLYREMASHKAYICPTLVTERNMTFIDQLSQQDDPHRKYALPRQLRNWKPENGMLTRYRTLEYIAYRKREYAAILNNVKLAQSLGVPILAGTDNGVAYTIPGFSLHEELALMVDAGLSPRQALQTATTNAARFWEETDGLGTLHGGSEASFVILNANPLDNIANTANIFAIEHRGEFLNRTFLDSLLTTARNVAAHTQN